MDQLPVCVVIPAYNRAAVLPRCIASVRAQHASPAEVIVVDDHSSDGTAAVAEGLGARVIRKPGNEGAGLARDTGLRATSCEWVAFLDSDDEWLPDHLAHLWEVRNGHALVGASSLHRDDGSHRFHGPITKRPTVLRSPDVLISTFNMFTASASMVRREAAVESGGFENRWGVEDFDLWVRLLEHHSAVCSPRVTVLYHVHDEQLSLHTARMLDGHRAVAEAHRARTGASPATLERWEGVLAWDRMKAALAAGRWYKTLEGSASVLRGRHRIVGVATQIRWRLAVRRRTARLSPDGRASVAVLVHDPHRRSAVIERFEERSLRDLSEAPFVRVLMEFAWRPAGLIVISGQRRATVLKMLGQRTLTPDQALAGDAASSPSVRARRGSDGEAFASPSDVHENWTPVSSCRRALSGAKRARNSRLRPGSKGAS